MGDGAYSDTHGAFQSNTSGPGGNTALTGREGTAAKNPVAQAAGRTGTDPTEPVGDQLRTTRISDPATSTEGRTDVSGQGQGAGGATHTGEVDEHGNPPKMGITEKIKQFISS